MKKKRTANPQWLCLISSYYSGRYDGLTKEKEAEMMNMKSFNTIQNRYSLLHILYWMTTCSLAGFIAIFLQSKGLSNTEIGTVSGLSLLAACVFSPAISSLTSRFSNISLQQFLMAGNLFSAICYLMVALLPLPKMMIMLVFILSYFVNTALVPLMSTISMDYIEKGEKLNFGLSRGLGSLSYATSAVLLTPVATMISPNALSLIFTAGVLLNMLVLRSLPAVYAPKAEEGSENKVEKSQKEASGSSFMDVVRRNPGFVIMVIGFGLLMAAASSLMTYLNNIIHSLGGSDSLYGICIFAMAASELPFMAVTPKLIKRFGAVPLLLAGGVIYFFRNAFIATAGAVPMVVFGMMLQGASYGLMTGVMTYFIQDELEARDTMMGQTLFIALTSGLGGGLGNFAGGLIQDLFGIDMMLASALATSLAGALIVAAITLPRIRSLARVRMHASGRISA